MIRSLFRHVNIQVAIRGQDRRVKVAVLDAVAAAAEEMAHAAVLKARFPHRFRNGVKIYRFKNFAAELFFFVGRMAAGSRKFFILSGLFVAYKAIHVGLF